jgi:diguanylate cyclase (GGDEF)-like protein/PAS domain S-box-containing protein
MSKLLKTKRLIWALVCAVVTGVALISQLSGTRYLAAVRAIEQTQALELAIASTLSRLKDGETGERGYILTGDDRFLEPYRAEQRDIAGDVLQLKAATRGDAEQTLRLASLEQLIADKHAFMSTTIRLRRDGDITRAFTLVAEGHGKQIMDAIRVTLGQMRQHERHVLVARKQEARLAQSVATWGVAGGSMITLLLAFLSLLTVHRDVEELKRTAEELAQSEEHFRSLSEHSSDLVRVLDMQGGVTYVSPSVERLLGYGVEEFKALSPLELLHPEDRERARRFLIEVQFDVKLPEILTYRLRHKSGEYRVFESRWVARRNERGKVTQMQSAGRDVTDRERANQQLNEQAATLRDLSLRDELTGLYNRRGFSEIAGQCREVAARDGRPAALIYIDVNGMKAINDELGHDAGDAALRDVAHVLTAGHGETDVVARLGGDEFVVFSLDFTPSDLEPLRMRLRELAADEVTRHRRGYRLSLSVGAAFMDLDALESLSELLDRADSAMYEQKQARALNAGITIMPLGRAD